MYMRHIIITIIHIYATNISCCWLSVWCYSRTVCHHATISSSSPHLQIRAPSIPPQRYPVWLRFAVPHGCTGISDGICSNCSPAHRMRPREDSHITLSRTRSALSALLGVVLPVLWLCTVHTLCTLSALCTPVQHVFCTVTSQPNTIGSTSSTRKKKPRCPSSHRNNPPTMPQRVKEPVGLG
jgi:hypothetical protein